MAYLEQPSNPALRSYSLKFLCRSAKLGYRERERERERKKRVKEKEIEKEKDGKGSAIRETVWERQQKSPLKGETAGI